MKRLVRIVERIIKILFNISEICMFCMMALVFIGVVMRYLFNNPLYWGEELTNLFLVCFTFFSCAEILMNKKHIKLTLFMDKYSYKIKNIVESFIACCGVLFSALVSKEIFSAALMAYNANMTSPTLLSIPLVLPYSIMFVGFLFLSIAFLIQLCEFFPNIK
ncbi:MAG: TRAP transporter small permease subunit [Desulfovermiculus sp.]|nr:TRAP transporter small permease subunit [Desulfovermiculus sp.]